MPSWRPQHATAGSETPSLLPWKPSTACLSLAALISEQLASLPSVQELCPERLPCTPLVARCAAEMHSEVATRAFPAAAARWPATGMPAGLLVPPACAGVAAAAVTRRETGSLAAEKEAATQPPLLQLAPLALPAKQVTCLASSSSSESLAPATPAVEDLSASGAAAELAPAGSGRRCAYVTLLTRDSYLMGAQALARSLAARHSRHPLLVMYTADTLPQAAVAALRREGCHMLAVERYVPAGELWKCLVGCRAVQSFAEICRDLGRACTPPWRLC